MNINIESYNQSLEYSISGKGHPILLLAGGPGMSSHYLGEVAKHLAVKNKVILLYQRGTSAKTGIDFDPEKINLTTYI